jgi:hypothetical protein
MTVEELKTLNIKELKAMAYDQIAIKEQSENNLRAINQVILEKSRPSEILPKDVPQG